MLTDSRVLLVNHESSRIWTLGGTTVGVSGPSRVLASIALRLAVQTHEEGAASPAETFSLRRSATSPITLSSRGSWDVLRGGVIRFSSEHRGEARRELERQIEEYASLFSPLIFVHAGCVAFEGQAVLLPGARQAGKSTLTRALLSLGAQYGSDGFALLQSNGRVRAHPRALALPWRGGTIRRVRASRLRAKPFEGDLPVRLVLDLAFVPGARKLSLRRRWGSSAALTLLQHTPAFRMRPTETMAALSAALRSAVVFKGTRGEADPSARSITRLLHAFRD